MKEDNLYPLYLTYLEKRMVSDEFGDLISKSRFSLLKISSSYFTVFKDRFEEDELFSKKIIELYKSDSRDKKIDVIINEDDRTENS